uniref:Cren protein n=1 Tax=Ignisphaera aggregans TaxID=334771 RepID=A0A7J3QE77_9CREN
MALKHGKYVYIERSDGYYVKARVFKSRNDDASKYIIIGPKTHKPPMNALILKEDQIPDNLKEKLYMV